MKLQISRLKNKIFIPFSASSIMKISCFHYVALPWQLFNILWHWSKQVFWCSVRWMMWSESEVSSQTLTSCLWEAAEGKVKEKEKNKEEKRDKGRISQRLSAGGRPQGRWEVRGSEARGEWGGNGWVREPTASSTSPHPFSKYTHTHTVSWKQ